MADKTDFHQPPSRAGSPIGWLWSQRSPAERAVLRDIWLYAGMLFVIGSLIAGGGSILAQQILWPAFGIAPMGCRSAHPVRCAVARLRPPTQGHIEPGRHATSPRTACTGTATRARTHHRRRLRPAPQDAAGEPQTARDPGRPLARKRRRRTDRTGRGTLGRRVLRPRARPARAGVGSEHMRGEVGIRADRSVQACRIYQASRISRSGTAFRKPERKRGIRSNFD